MLSIVLQRRRVVWQGWIYPLSSMAPVILVSQCRVVRRPRVTWTKAGERPRAAVWPPALTWWSQCVRPTGKLIGISAQWIRWLSIIYCSQHPSIIRHNFPEQACWHSSQPTWYCHYLPDLLIDYLSSQQSSQVLCLFLGLGTTGISSTFYKLIKTLWKFLLRSDDFQLLIFPTEPKLKETQRSNVLKDFEFCFQFSTSTPSRERMAIFNATFYYMFALSDFINFCIQPWQLLRGAVLNRDPNYQNISTFHAAVCLSRKLRQKTVLRDVLECCWY